MVEPHDIVKGLETMRGRIKDLCAELRAIRVWDRHYSRQKIHDPIDRAAWQGRRRRWAEIQGELDALRTALPASVPKGSTRKGLLDSECSQSRAGKSCLTLVKR